MTLGNPWLLLLIPFLYLLLKVFSGRSYLGYSSIRALPQLTPFKALLVRLPGFFWFMAVAFIILGLCHPQSELQETELTTQGLEMILAVDTSFSMTGHALEMVKGVIKDFIKRRPNDLTGITIFGTDAALVVLPTREYTLLENSLDRIQASQAGFQTAIGEGLFTSIMALVEGDMGKEFEINKIRDSLKTQQLGDYALRLARRLGIKKNRVIVLFTDGIYNVGIDPTKPLKLASRLGIRIYVVAVEPSAETGVEPEQAAQRIADLRNGVASTGGRYLKVEGTEGLKKQYEALDARAIWTSLSPDTIYGEVEGLYREIDTIERDKLFLEKITRKKDLYFYPTLLGLVSLLGMVVVENVWVRIP
ncbi:MAG TPA: vWA domain-containing protein [Candidatus Tripitaka californicus]|uniref:vWA domain-containing protein n=1 Tax=Candidatus Tripitaka californicus TaxID=3367616 RepID=UPI00402A41A6|nr:VWA domain-containing protein [Planctomycetota bacterium]